MSDDTGPRRLDIELVRRGLMASRAQARAAIEAAKVSVEGVIATKPGQIVSTASMIDAAPAHPWASRGGLKLAHALDAFGVNPSGRACLDIGSSTGGFTDVLLARGARQIVAVDVGNSQLHPKLRADPRVRVLEATDARNLSAEMIGDPPALVVVDVSFISLAKLLARPLELAAPEAELVGLFKPQFEVGPSLVGKGGIVSDQAGVARAAQALEAWLEARGWPVLGWTPSPIRGGDGNLERLFHCQKPLSGIPEISYRKSERAYFLSYYSAVTALWLGQSDVAENMGPELDEPRDLRRAARPIRPWVGGTGLPDEDHPSVAQGAPRAV